VEFRLAPDALEWMAGRRSGRMPYRDLRRLRLSFRPVTMQSHRFLPRSGRPRAKSSCHRRRGRAWSSRSGSTALCGVHARAAPAPGGARPDARFETGSPPLLYWPGVAVFAVVALCGAALAVRALQSRLLAVPP